MQLKDPGRRRLMGALAAPEMQAQLPWDEAEEVAFECEPGTLTEKKLRVITLIWMCMVTALFT